MANSNGRITAPVRIADLRTVLNSNLTDLGAIITAGTYNRWSKYKPVSLNKVDTYDEWDPNQQDDGKNDGWKLLSNWFRGNADNYNQAYGWSAPYNSVQRIALANYSNHLTDPLNGWVPETPAGGVASPFRLTDFAGYVHDAPTPPAQLNCPSSVIVPLNPDNDRGISLVPTYIKQTDADYILRFRRYISPKDVLHKMWQLGSLESVHEGFALVTQNWQSVVRITTDEAMVINHSDIGPSTGQLHDGDFYWVCMFYTDNTDLSQANFYAPFPLMEAKLLEIRTTNSQPIQDVSATLRAEISSAGVITGYLTLTDTGGRSQTITNVTVTAYVDGNAVLYRNFGSEQMGNHQTVREDFTMDISGSLPGYVTLELHGNGTMLYGPIVPVTPTS